MRNCKGGRAKLSDTLPSSLGRRDGGSVEPIALDDRATNIAQNPLAALLYSASAAVCTPNSLSQEVGLGLGAQAGEQRLRDVFTEAGFTQFRRTAETPLNVILEARP
jgi:hypothetical protein